jgi:MFS family permease
MVLSVMGLLLPSISSDLNLSPTQQGVLSSAAFWGNIALTLPLGWWASRFRPKPLTTITLAVGTGLLFVQGWAPVFAVLLLGRLAFGVSLIAREPARALLIKQWFPARETMLANGLSSAMFGLIVGGGLVATPLILDVVDGDWRLVLRVFGVLFVVLTVVWEIVGRERSAPAQRRDSPWQAGILRSALGHRDLWVAGLGFMGASMAWSAFLSFYPTLMQDSYDLSLRWSGLILALSIFTGGLSGIAISVAVMTIGRRRTILQGVGILMTGTYLGMTLTGSLPLILVLALFNGIAWGFYPVLYTVPFHLPGIKPREIVVAVAATMTMTAIGTGTGPLVAGLLQEALGDLGQALFIIGFATLSLSVAGTMLRPSSEPTPAKSATVASQ